MDFWNNDAWNVQSLDIDDDQMANASQLCLKTSTSLSDYFSYNKIDGTYA